MSAVLFALLDKTKLWLALAGAAALAILVALLRGYQAGKAAGEAARQRALAESIRRIQEHRTNAHSLPEVDLDEELRKWARED